MTMATQAEPNASAHMPGFGGRPIVEIALVFGILLVAFWPILLGIYGSWLDERAYMEHGILVVPAACYMAWTRRDEIAATPRKPSGWGVVLVFAGALQALFGLAAQWVWVSRTAFLVSLVGCILALYGPRMVRTLGYPLCTLILMIAPPTFIFERLTLSLQLLASRLGAACLEAMGFSVFREGNILQMVGIKLSVEEACSGIRSLIAILFMCSLYNFFFVRGIPSKALVFAASIPIAVIGNVGRIVATGIAGQYDPELASGMVHETFGYISVTLAAAGCVAFHLLLRAFQRARHSHYV